MDKHRKNRKRIAVLLFLGLFLSCVQSYAQVYRIDPNPIMTTSGNVPFGGYPQLYAIPGATIQLCTDAACAIPATAYTDGTGNTACSSSAPVTLPGSTACTSASGAQGQFGFWIRPGTYYFKITTPSGQSFGPYPVSSPNSFTLASAGLVSSDSSGVLAPISAALDASRAVGSSASVKIAATAAALPASGGTIDARGLAGAQTWNSDAFNGVTKPIDFLCGATTYTVSVNSTIPTNVHLVGMQGCLFSVNNGVTLTINGSMDAPLVQIFSGPGTIAIGPLIKQVYPEWWTTNTVPGGTDMTSAITTAIATGHCVSLGATTYSIASAGVVIQPSGAIDPCIIGQGFEESILKMATGGTGQVINVNGAQRCKFSKFTVDANLTASYGIYMASSGCIQGIFTEVEVKNAQGTPGVGIYGAGINHSILFTRPWITYNKIGMQFTTLFDQNTLIDPLIYSNKTENLHLGDGSGSPVQSFKIIGGQIEQQGDEGGGIVKNIVVNKVTPLTIVGTYFESAGNAGSMDISVIGASTVDIQGMRSTGNNVANKSIVLAAATQLSLVNAQLDAFLQYPITESGSDHITIVNGGNFALSGAVLPFSVEGPVQIGTDPSLNYTSTLVGNMTIGQATANKSVLWNTTGAGSDTSGWYFGNNGSPIVALKSAIIAERTASSGRGRLSLCVQNIADNSNITAANCGTAANQSGITVDAAGTQTFTTNAAVGLQIDGANSITFVPALFMAGGGASDTVDYGSGQGRVVGIGGVTAANNLTNASMMRIGAAGGAGGAAYLASDASGTGRGEPIVIAMCTAGACATGLAGASQIAQFGLRDTSGGGLLVGASGTVPATGQLALTSTIATYNNVATVSDGIAYEVGTANLTGLTANTGPTTVYAVPASAGGLYRVSCYTVVTTAAGTSSTLPNCQISWTDNDTNVATGPFTVTPSSANNTIGTTNSLTASTPGDGVVVIDARASTNIQYSTAGYASNPGATMQYAIHVRIERLGS